MKFFYKEVYVNVEPSTCTLDKKSSTTFVIATKEDLCIEWRQNLTESSFSYLGSFLNDSVSLSMSVRKLTIQRTNSTSLFNIKIYSFLH